MTPSRLVRASRRTSLNHLLAMISARARDRVAQVQTLLSFWRPWTGLPITAGPLPPTR
jgi:hypothetical protein